MPITEALVARAESLACDYRLRGHDAIQLASALGWQESIGTEIVLATFDREFRVAGRQAGRQLWPASPARNS